MCLCVWYQNDCSGGICQVFRGRYVPGTVGKKGGWEKTLFFCFVFVCFGLLWSYHVGGVLFCGRSNSKNSWQHREFLKKEYVEGICLLWKNMWISCGGLEYIIEKKKIWKWRRALFFYCCWLLLLLLLFLCFHGAKRLGTKIYIGSYGNGWLFFGCGIFALFSLFDWIVVCLFVCLLSVVALGEEKGGSATFFLPVLSFSFSISFLAITTLAKTRRCVCWISPFRSHCVLILIFVVTPRITRCLETCTNHCLSDCGTSRGLFTKRLSLF